MGIRADKGSWEKFAQTWELGWWHQYFAGKQKWIKQGDPLDASKKICNVLGITKELIENKTLLDIGCGPTGRLMSLEPYKGRGRWIGFDPLISHYQELPGAILTGYDELIEGPCEEWQPRLLGICDVVVSINALDHGYDLLASLLNIRHYMKPGATAIISFDTFAEEHPDITHPIRVSASEVTELLQELEFEIVREHCTPAYEDRTNWGGGGHVHWTLKKYV